MRVDCKQRQVLTMVTSQNVPMSKHRIVKKSQRQNVPSQNIPSQNVPKSKRPKSKHPKVKMSQSKNVPESEETANIRFSFEPEA